MTVHNLFDVKDYDKGLYSEQQITVTHRNRPTLIALELFKLLAYHSNGYEAVGGRIFVGVTATRFYNQKACQCERACYTSQWSELIPVVGWFGQKSQNATKQCCLSKQS